MQNNNKSEDKIAIFLKIEIGGRKPIMKFQSRKSPNKFVLKAVLNETRLLEMQQSGMMTWAMTWAMTWTDAKDKDACKKIVSV